jgi:rare lipoprotein A
MRLLRIAFLVVFGLLLLLAGLSTCALAESGVASWYEHGRLTANGERFKPDGITCAHRQHAFETRLRVTRIDTGRAIVCRVNDRGPAAWTGRIVDLSRGAARELGILRRGVVGVQIEVVR